MFGLKELKRKNAFIFVTGNVKVNVPITVEDFIKKILQWIGFATEEHRNCVYDDPIDSFSW